MLLELSIRNFAIIDDLQIRLAGGFTVLSGETGAGKSILLNAVNLLLGARASAELIRTGADSAELEALFEITPDSPVRELLQAQDLSADEGLLIRRLIFRQERARIYINGRLTTLQVLNGLAPHLASITGQHAHQLLLQEPQQLLILDHYANARPLRQKVADTYQALRPRLQQLRKLQSTLEDRRRQQPRLKQELDEIETVDLQPQEDEQLEQERVRLKNAHLMLQTLNETIDTLYSGSGAIAERLVMVAGDISRLTELDSELAGLARQVDQIAIQVEDLTDTLRRYLKSVDLDADRLDHVERRLTRLQKLKRKYGGSLEQVQAHQQHLQRELAALDDLEAEIEQLQKLIQQEHQQLVAAVVALSNRRQEAAATLGRHVERELAELQMPDCRFEVELPATPATRSDPWLTHDGSLITETGLERACFMVAPNPGETPKSLAAIASGGELSRLLLAIKALTVGLHGLETIIFDEVDAGIGGGVAEVVGRKIARLATRHQVLCITHLPQIARFADHHFKISKHLQEGRTVTRIEHLAGEQRVSEMARMLGGIRITATSRAHAQEMLEVHDAGAA